jgi:hypothetical protein
MSDGPDPAVLQPGDELAQSGGVGRELADGVGTVGGGLDADPVTGIADPDAGGVLVLDRQGGELGTLLGLAADLLGVAAGVANLGGGSGLGLGGVDARPAGRGAGGAGVGLANGPSGLHNRGTATGQPGRRASGGGVGKGTSRPNGIHRGRAERGRRRSPTGGPKTLPSPVEPSG